MAAPVTREKGHLMPSELAHDIVIGGRAKGVWMIDFFLA